jgi:hypothetical protein
MQTMSEQSKHQGATAATGTASGSGQGSQQSQSSSVPNEGLKEQGLPKIELSEIAPQKGLDKRTLAVQSAA